MAEATPPETTSREIHRRAQLGLWLVMSRQGFVAFLFFASGIVLARTLSPADFGLFAIATFVVGLLTLIADLGLHAALVQSSATPTTRDVQTAFTIQQIAASVAFLALWAAASWLPVLYPLASHELVPLVRLLSLDLYLTSWCRPSEALLERSLRYHRLAPIDVTGGAVYCGTAVVLALAGLGVLSFAAAFLASSLVRAVLVHRAAPWKIAFAFDRRAASSLLSLGVPLQVGRVVAQAQYWITPTLVAGMIGPSAAGLLQWAAGNGRKPLEVLESFARVSLPHFSRLQHDEEEVDRTLVRYVTVFTLVSGLWLVVLAVAGHDLVEFIYSERWLPAVSAMVIFAGVGLLVALRVIVSAALASLGRSMLIARVGIATALATLALNVPLVLWLGPLGVPLGQLVGAAIVLPFLASGLRSGGMTRVTEAAAGVLVPMAVAIAVGLLVHRAALSPGARGLLTAGVMTLAYTIAVWLAGPTWLRDSVSGAVRAKIRSYR